MERIATNVRKGTEIQKVSKAVHSSEGLFTSIDIHNDTKVKKANVSHLLGKMAKNDEIIRLGSIGKIVYYTTQGCNPNVLKEFQDLKEISEALKPAKSKIQATKKAVKAEDKSYDVRVVFGLNSVQEVEELIGAFAEIRKASNGGVSIKYSITPSIFD
jgi:hypothetical protein